MEHGCPQFAVFAQRSADVFYKGCHFREGEMIFKGVQFSLGEGSVNCVEDFPLEAGGAGHWWNGGICRFFDDVIEHLLVLGQWTGDEEPPTRFNHAMRLAKREV